MLFALISVVSFIGYEFQGIGKFCKVFLPWDLSPNTYAIILMSITAVYVVMGGMLSVVLTDFAQFCLMALSALVIGGIAIIKVDAGHDRSDHAGGLERTFASAGTCILIGPASCRR